MSFRDGAQHDRAYMATGGPTYVRANSAASSRVRTVTTRVRRRGGSNTKSGMPRKLARHNRSSGIARPDARMMSRVAERSQPKPRGDAMPNHRQPAWGAADRRSARQ